ncbi:MAG: metallophosphoesterase [Firmicutes bacterium]|nr:metallophosphoesterase [Bacillota bacterium]
MAKKLLAILAALCLVAAMGSVGASAVIEYDPDTERTVLYTNDIGFHILAIPDAHQTTTEDANLVAYITAAIKYMADQNTPLDLIIFLGDAVTGSANADLAAVATAASRLVAPIRAAGIPYTVVLGNEDCGALSRKAVMDVWRDAGDWLELSYGVEVPADPPTDPPSTTTEIRTESVRLFAEPDAVYGDTNFMYNIKKKFYTDNVWGRETSDSFDKNGKANKVSKIVPFARLFLFDIGSKNAGQSGAPYVRADQLAWFTANNTDTLPTFVFQHIPLPEVYNCDYFLATPFNWALPGSTNIVGTYFWNMANYIHMTGTVLEAEKTPHFSDKEFEALTAKGNVKAAFFGNNHKNNFVEPLDKIDLVQLPGAAWNGGSGTYLVRGASFVSLRPNAAGNDVTYGNDFFTYRQASRVGGFSGLTVDKGLIKDTIQIVPFLLQNLLIGLLSPLRWIF